MKRRDLLAGATATACASIAHPCEAGSWLLVYRYVVNVQETFHGAPIYETREQFDGLRFASEAEAYAGAAALRQTGVVLPTLDRFGRDSNVIPESITPMLSLYAQELGIPGPR